MTPDTAPIPDAALIPAAEAGLQHFIQEIPETVVLPDAAPPECKWPVVDATSATAVVAALSHRQNRIAAIKAMAEEMVRREETEIRRLQFAVGGYNRTYGDKVVESWGTLESWAAANRGKAKHVKLPFGKLQFRAVAAAYRIPDEKVDAFVAWCNRTGNTHLYRLETSVRMKQLGEHMDANREMPTDEDGVALVEVLPAGRYESFSVSAEVGP